MIDAAGFVVCSLVAASDDAKFGQHGGVLRHFFHPHEQMEEKVNG